MSLLMLAGISIRSFLLSLGKITVLSPALWPAITFSLTPPISKTLPLKVTSPVMPTLLLTETLVRAETRAVVMAIPAEGPSLGTAPSGTWI